MTPKLTKPPIAKLQTIIAAKDREIKSMQKTLNAEREAFEAVVELVRAKDREIARLKYVLSLAGLPGLCREN